MFQHVKLMKIMMYRVIPVYVSLGLLDKTQMGIAYGLVNKIKFGKMNVFVSKTMLDIMVFVWLVLNTLLLPMGSVSAKRIIIGCLEN